MSSIKVPIIFDFEGGGSKKDLMSVKPPPGSYLVSFGIAIILFGLLAGRSSFWDNSGFEIFASLRYSFIWGIGFIIGGITFGKTFNPILFLNPWGYVSVIPLVFLSDWLVRYYNLLQGPSIRGEILLGGLFVYYVLKKQIRNFWSFFLIISVLLLTYSFFCEANGRVLFSDDHASFIYRLTLLKENFPYIPFYSPHWNAGVDAREFFATGVLSPFLLFSPLIAFFSVIDSYNIIVVATLFFLLPLSVGLAASKYGGSRFVQFVSALLSLGVSLLWYRWSLKYGTLGFTVSVALIPLNLALLSCFLAKDIHISRSELLLFFLSFTLTLLWPGAIIVFLPFCFVGVLSLPRLIKNRGKLLWIILFSLLQLSWVIPFATVSKVASFVVSESSHYPTATIDTATLAEKSLSNDKKLFKMKASGFNLKDALSHLREQAISANPLLLFLGLPGIFLISNKFHKKMLFLSAGWFLVCGAILYSFKPQLELDRMLIVYLICMCVPTALTFEKIWNSVLINPTNIKLLLTSLTGGFIFAIPFSVSYLLSNRSIEQYYFASPLVENLAGGIKQHAGDGRVLFSGFVLQDISGGHVAPLASFTNKPLITAAYYHTQWWYTDVIPKSFRTRKDSGIQEFLNLLNVSSIVAHEPFWKNYFLKHPEQYEKVWSFEKFSIFKRLNYTPNYFIEGSGEIVSQSSNDVVLKLTTKDAVIKFTYFPFIKADAAKADGCTVTPYLAYENSNFINLTNCPINTDIKISSIPIWQRVWNAL